jgi:hypothetical protein
VAPAARAPALLLLIAALVACGNSSEATPEDARHQACAPIASQTGTRGEVAALSRTAADRDPVYEKFAQAMAADDYATLTATQHRAIFATCEPELRLAGVDVDRILNPQPAEPVQVVVCQEDDDGPSSGLGGFGLPCR